MSEKSPRRFIVGNWKMHKTIHETQSFIEELVPHIGNISDTVILAVPYPSLATAAKSSKETPLKIAAQNMHEETNGAYTGEVSADMIKDAGAEFVLLGHSERRQLFHETDHIIEKKLCRALTTGLIPILCVGETLEEHEKGNRNLVLKGQLTSALKDISRKQLESIIIAYEPVWAIGTGKTASPSQAEEAHQYCRTLIKENWGEEAGSSVSILYGGSVKPDNAKDLMQQENINGLLVGGASLSSESFRKIIHYHNHETQKVLS